MAANLADAIFKCISMNEYFLIVHIISLIYVTWGLIDNMAALVQIMAWHRTGTKPLSEVMLVCCTDVYMSLSLIKAEANQPPFCKHFQMKMFEFRLNFHWSLFLKFQMTSWRRPSDKPLSEPMMARLPTHICVTRPKWVNNWHVPYPTGSPTVTRLGLCNSLPYYIG